jgi:hypothetical protein
VRIGWWASIYFYASADFWHWWPLVSAGSLLGVEEFLERYAPWASLRKLPDKWRNGLKIAALVLSVFYSGYLAWSDEHQRAEAERAQRMTAEGERDEARRELERLRSQPAAAAKMVFNRIEPLTQSTVAQNGDAFISYKVWYKNDGSLASNSFQFRAIPLIEDNVLSHDEEESFFDMLKRISPVDVVAEIQPGENAYFIPSAGYMQSAWDDFMQKRKPLFYLFSTLTYRDDNAQDQHSVTTESCLIFKNGNLNEWGYCATGHNKIIRN